VSACDIFLKKNIVSLHEHFEEKDAICTLLLPFLVRFSLALTLLDLVLELVQGGNLLTYITRHGALGSLLY
jgi:hypothetical protein